MSGLLDHLREDFDRRMALRRRMLDHLGLRLSEDEAEALRPHVRATLTACATCGNPEICEFWMAKKRAGLPVFCRARDAFLQLEAARALEDESV